MKLQYVKSFQKELEWDLLFIGWFVGQMFYFLLVVISK